MQAKGKTSVVCDPGFLITPSGMVKYLAVYRRIKIKYTNCTYIRGAHTHLITRIFKNGNSQAVRIPQEFRLDVSQVEISRNPNGDLLIHPVPINRGEALLAAIKAFDDEFAGLLEEDYQQQSTMQDREAL